eukprot:CAMPEP_0198218968 /NCGR_PEP_ID=MMETSP1445-20131203/72089_1 /TAXON_ID=36898 /ORGANISM="Pyramimonas sp., Strain CCMP2087" /LENGTH=146 /DNA_ID=CAMNT_0043896237 /DNA_START=236 /DNA_END=673 /DNA_ORIENTATION=+
MAAASGGVHTDNCPSFCICRLKSGSEEAVVKSANLLASKPLPSSTSTSSSSANLEPLTPALSPPQPAHISPTSSDSLTRPQSASTPFASTHLLPPHQGASGGRVFVVGNNPQVMARQVPGAVYIPPNSFAQTWQGEYSETSPALKE